MAQAPMPSQEPVCALWPLLPQDILALVAKALHNPLQVASFRQVCRQWKLAAEQATTELRPRVVSAPLLHLFPKLQALDLTATQQVLAWQNEALPHVALRALFAAAATPEGLLNSLLLQQVEGTRTLETVVLQPTSLACQVTLERVCSLDSLRRLALTLADRQPAPAPLGVSLAHLAALLARNCRQLIELELSRADLDVPALDVEALVPLWQLPQLHTLVLRVHNPVCGAYWDDGNQVLALEVLRDSSLAAVALLTQLQALDLSGTQFASEESLQLLAPLQQLTCLGLARTGPTTDEGLEALTVLTRLRRLDLGGCARLSRRGLAHFAACTALEWLGAGSAKLTTPRSLAAALQPFVRLTHLSLKGCRQVGDAGLAAVFAGLPLVASLDVTGTAVAELPGLAALARLTCLCALHTRLEARALHQLAARPAPALRCLLVGGVHGSYGRAYMGPDILEAIGQLRSLTMLALREIDPVPSESHLEHLARLPHLALLDLTESITSLAVLHGLAAAPGLQRLYGVAHLTRQAAPALQPGHADAHVGGQVGQEQQPAWSAFPGVAARRRQLDSASGLPDSLVAALVEGERFPVSGLEELVMCQQAVPPDPLQLRLRHGWYAGADWANACGHATDACV